MQTIHDVLSHDPMGELEFVSRETFLIDPWLCGVDVSNNTCADDDLYSIGCLPPHFPVPAIYLPATYHPLTGWSVWQYANEQDQD